MSSLWFSQVHTGQTGTSSGPVVSPGPPRVTEHLVVPRVIIEGRGNRYEIPVVIVYHGNSLACGRGEILLCHGERVLVKEYRCSRYMYLPVVQMLRDR